MGKLSRVRKCVQAGFALLQNLHLKGLFTGRIYTGGLKRFCVPGMNCYACPAALGACPMGALQSLLGGRRAKPALWVLGFLAAVGLLLGRFVCAWLCLFGLIQELLYKIPVKKWKMPPRADRALRYLKYVLLAVFVVLLPLLLREGAGPGDPWFCKYICPVGTLEGAVPLMLADKALRAAARWLFAWKFAILGAVLVLSVFIHRPFCRYLCPLGAFYALFQRFSLLQLRLDESKCVRCGACAGVCKMGVDPLKNPNGAECIRCGACTEGCPTGALSFRFVKSLKTDGSHHEKT